MPNFQSDQRTIVLIGGFASSLITFRGPLIAAFVHAGYRVVTAAPRQPNSDFEDHLQRLGAEFRALPLQRAGMNIVRDFMTFFAILRLIRRERPRFLLAYTIKPVIYGSLAGALLGVPRICSIITGLGFAFGDAAGGGRGFLKTLVTFMYGCALKYNDCVFFQNPDDLQVFLSCGIAHASKSRLINGSGVDLNYYKVERVPVGQPVFLLMARLIWEKGIGEYVEAARTIIKSCPGARFLLAGSPDDNPTGISMQTVLTWHEEGTIEYLGHLSDVRLALVRATVYVLPSSYREGLPRSVIEAMSMGRPIITTDAPGCRETVADCGPVDSDGVQTGRNGFLIRLKSVPSLVSAMMRFVEDPALAVRMGTESRRIAERRYDVHEINRQIMESVGAIGPASKATSQ